MNSMIATWMLLLTAIFFGMRWGQVRSADPSVKVALRTWTQASMIGAGLTGIGAAIAVWGVDSVVTMVIPLGILAASLVIVANLQLGSRRRAGMTPFRTATLFGAVYANLLAFVALEHYLMVCFIALVGELGVLVTVLSSAPIRRVNRL